MTATCLETVVGGKQGHAPCKIFLLQQILQLCLFKLEKIRSFHNIEVNQAITRIKKWCLSA